MLYPVPIPDNLRFSFTEDTMKYFLRLVAIVLLSGSVASAATFTVNRAADGLTAGGCDAADCSLRDAITAAAATGPDLIHFNIPAAGPFLSEISFPLPLVPPDTTIDATTQPGWAANAPKIELRGKKPAPTDPPTAWSPFPALRLSSGTTVKGLAINGLFQYGISIDALATGVTIQSNFIGTNLTGTTGAGPINGIISSGSSVTIGGATAAARNVLSAELEVIRINGGTGVTIQGNYIGVNAAGTAVLANNHLTPATTGPEFGIAMESPGNTIADNVIGGCTTYGVQLAAATTVTGNEIGVNAAGSAALPNGTGVAISYGTDGRTFIGGATAAARNVIASNRNGQIITAGAPVTIEGNYIGTNAAGTSALSSTVVANGIEVGSGDVLIKNNLISGNTGDGILLSEAATVKGNLIGTNAAGTSAVANVGAGITIVGTNSVIGGAAVADRNTIRFNSGSGIAIQGGGGNTIENNAIQDNGADGVEITEGGSANRITNNVFSGNGNLGIDLAPNGATANDAGDNDSGANALQNFPTLLGAYFGGTGTTAISGVLNSAPSSVFRVELFGSPACDASGFGEGAVLLGSVNATTDAVGNASFTFASALATTGVITATATDALGNTSEFSPCRPITAPPTASLSIADATATEGDSGTSNLSFTVSLSAAASTVVTVQYSTIAGTALEGLDYQFASGTVTFPSGQTAQTVLVPVIGDLLDEPNQTFRVLLANASDALIGDGDATGTIADNDATPALSINDATATELDSGTAPAVFTITLVGRSEQPVSVNYQTAIGTAGSADFISATGSFTFNDETNTRSVTVTVRGDLLDEPDETFTLQLSSASNATITDGTGLGTIQDNDPLPQLSIGDAPAIGESAGSAVFVVTLTGPTERTVTVNYSTLDGSAVAGQDYQTTSGSLSFAAGTSQQTVSVPILDDFLSEPSETFRVVLNSPGNATLGDNEAIVTITDADAGALLSIGDAAVVEGSGSATFLVTLAGTTTGTVTVNFATADGSASAPGDYQAASGSLSFPAGTTQQTVTVVVNDDTLDETDETFRVQLSNVSANAVIADATGNGSIIDNDGMPSLSISDADFAEFGASQFTVTLSEPTGRVVSFRFNTSSGSAIAGADYHERTDGVITIFPGKTIVSVPVQTIADAVDEGDETFTITISSADGAVISDGTGVGTILDDDLTAVVNVFESAVIEGHSGTVEMPFLIALDGPTDQIITVNFATSSNDATAGTDYTTTTGSLTFAPGEIEKTVNVTVNGDISDEDNESLQLVLSNATNALLGQAQATGTIYDDDGSSSLTIGNASVSEGNSGTADATFTVTLLPVSGRTVTVEYVTASGSADVTDFEPASGVINFAPGETSRTVVVKATGDSTFETDETFSVELANPVGANIVDGSGAGTIVNDDARPIVDADLRVTLSAATTGSRVIYTVTVSNLGPAAASGVTLTDTLGPATRFETIAAASGWSCTTPSTTVFGGAVTCSNASLAAGASATFTITTRLDCKKGSANNSATASSGTPDPNSVNNAASTNAGCS